MQKQKDQHHSQTSIPLSKANQTQATSSSNHHDSLSKTPHFDNLNINNLQHNEQVKTDHGTIAENALNTVKNALEPSQKTPPPHLPTRLKKTNFDNTLTIF